MKERIPTPTPPPARPDRQERLARDLERLGLMFSRVAPGHPLMGPLLEAARAWLEERHRRPPTAS